MLIFYNSFRIKHTQISDEENYIILKFVLEIEHIYIHVYTYISYTNFLIKYKIYIC